VIGACAASARRVRHEVTQNPWLLQAADSALYRYGRMRTALTPRHNEERCE
jgi:predicted protein tyrosine phosphatase